MKGKAVLGYSGGLDTSVAIRWLQTVYDVDVVCVLVDVGQPLTNLEDAKRRGVANGATKVLVVDAKEEFARDFLTPALQANAVYEEVYPLATSLARPLIAKRLVEVAHAEGATIVAHGCTAKGNDQVRFEVTIRALDPSLKVVAPLREWQKGPVDGYHLRTRDEEIAYAAAKGIQIPDVARKSIFSTDENLWGRSVEAGILEDPSKEAVEAAFEWTTNPVDAPEAPELVTIGFEAGVPVSIDGKRLSLVELVRWLNDTAGRHGVGRVDHVENRLVGIKSREIYEAPAAVTLIAAHRALEALTLTRDVAHFKTILEDRFAELVYDGLWYSPLARSIRAFVATSQEHVTGDVTVKLYKGSIALAGRDAARSLYNKHLATYDAADTFNHASAEGFIDIFGLPLANHSRVFGAPVETGAHAKLAKDAKPVDPK
ncbi:MAG TPA: argininosuccinate synthase [Candidatus Thermoplasmatota archaeon]|nr:argininosuccinate synthase [Candidatus Thermoplasmatota archaeon]